MLAIAKKFHDIGWAIHWLMPKSKRPIEKRWTSGPRKNWDELKRTYRPGFNMGVRLGEASKLDDGTFLGVIDVDVKSTDPKYLKQVNDYLNTLDIAPGPRVFSGRGGGSMHIYIRGVKPFSPRRLKQSPDIIHVMMPSVEPSEKDKKGLPKDELAAGWRLRAAWEVSLMGEGQQVVLPPSIHPDSGKEYTWSDDGYDEKVGPIFEDGGSATGPVKKETLKDWKAVPVDLICSTLPDEVVAQITTGEGVEDRSAALFGVSLAMKTAGFSDQEILSVLTDRDNFLGAVGYDHAKTDSRRRAAEWIKNFTLKKADKASVKNDFEIIGYDFKEPEMNPEVASLIASELTEVGDWRTLIERNKQDGRPFNNLKNLLLIFDGLADFEPFVAHDEFSVESQWKKDMPWGVKIGHAITDEDCRRVKEYLTKHYRMEPSVEKILEALLIRADKERHHPVRAHVLGIEWDGVDRAEHWLKAYLGAEGPEEYLRAVGLKTLVAMIARVFDPGCKHDHVLILEGNQGAGKSTTARILSEPWFSDTFLNVNDKDAVMNMQGVWVNELGELSAMNRSEVNTLKEFVTRQVDKIRPPYGRLSLKFPRQNIFIGTTNNKDYLKDKTGNRRFWPVKIKKLKWKELRRDRDQLLAEAYVWWKMEEPLYLNKAQDILARHEQSLRVEHDELEDIVADFLASPRNGLPKEFTTFDVLEMGPGPLAGLRNDRATQMRLGNILRSCGYDNESRYDVEAGRSSRKWRKIQVKK